MSIDSIFQDDNWQTIPTSWTDWERINPSQSVVQQNPIMIFRTHKQHRNPLLNERQTDGILHAAPAPIFPNHPRYNAQIFYGGPERFTFITTYFAKPNQRFYPDETLELSERERFMYISQGETGVTGYAIDDIEAFDLKGCHFETNASGCECAGVYMVTLPMQHDAILKPRPVDHDRVRVLRIDNRMDVFSILDAAMNSPNAGSAPNV